jgi:hypothetical protein
MEFNTMADWAASLGAAMCRLIDDANGITSAVRFCGDYATRLTFGYVIMFVLAVATLTWALTRALRV